MREEKSSKELHTHIHAQHTFYRVVNLEPISPSLNKWKDALQKCLEIIEAGHCRMAFPKEDSLRVTAFGLHLNTY